MRIWRHRANNSLKILLSLKLHFLKQPVLHLSSGTPFERFSNNLYVPHSTHPCKLITTRCSCPTGHAEQRSSIKCQFIHGRPRNIRTFCNSSHRGIPGALCPPSHSTANSAPRGMRSQPTKACEYNSAPNTLCTHPPPGYLFRSYYRELSSFNSFWLLVYTSTHTVRTFHIIYNESDKFTSHNVRTHSIYHLYTYRKATLTSNKSQEHVDGAEGRCSPVSTFAVGNLPSRREKFTNRIIYQVRR